MIVTTQTVGEIAAGQPATIRIFQGHGIDFCCGGARRLNEVCQERGLDVATLVAELEAAVTSPDADGRVWNEAPLGALTRHIVARYHESLRAELVRVGALMEKVRRVHGERHPEVAAMAAELARLDEDLRPHMMKEERVLFPYVGRLEEIAARGDSIAASPFGTVGNPIAVMVQEHEAAGEILAELRRLSGGFVPPADACNSFRGLYHGLLEMERELHEHIHLENNILFPRAVALEERLARTDGVR
jgi:regulator of cell morphogenesis and NO signaling